MHYRILKLFNAKLNAYWCNRSSAPPHGDRPAFVDDRQLVMRMLKREQQLRMCDETQRLYDVRDLPSATSVPPEAIEDSIQLQVR